MLLALLLAVPFLTGILTLGVRSHALAKGLSYAGILLSAIIMVLIAQNVWSIPENSYWLLELRLPWIPSWSVYWHLGLDFFAYGLIALTLVLAFCAIYISFPQSPRYFAALNWAVFGVFGLFLSADVFLFFVFWEVALLPIYWILLMDGNKLKQKDALRFIVLTQISGLFLLIAVLGLAYLSGQATGHFTFEYTELIKTLSPDAQWIFWLFLIAFLIKLPTIPFHGWMPSLFSDGPASTILVAILVKTSIFGLVRFSWPIFPDASAQYALVVMIIGAITLLYGAVLAFSQNEPKRVTAYITLSHAGLLVMGVFSEEPAGFYGVLILLIASALSTTALLMIFERRQQVNFADLSGLWQSHPRLSVVLLTMLLASMGFPIFGNFVGEWLILWSIFSTNIGLAVIVSVSIVLSAAYGLKFFQRLALGQPSVSKPENKFLDLSSTEVSVLGLLTLLIVGLGLAPSMMFHKKFSPIKTTLTTNEIGLPDLPEVSP